MNPNLQQIVPAVVSYVVEHGGYVTKTKLLKLLYLCDVEYYRIHRTTITAFQWKFFHLGPWAREFDQLLDVLVGQYALIESASQRAEFDTKFYKSPEPSDLVAVFGTWKEAAPVKLVLDMWGESSTGDILDYVYFHTEPMEYGIRNEPLDFTKISEQAPSVYVRQASGKTKGEIEAARKKFQEGMNSRRAERQKGFAFTPPRYDEEFLSSLSKLNGPGL